MYKKVFVICMLATTLMAVPADAGGLIKRPDLTIFSPLRWRKALAPWQWGVLMQQPQTMSMPRGGIPPG